MTYVRLNKSQIETQYRLSLSRLQLAYNEVEMLRTGGYGEDLQAVLTDLDRAISWLTYERNQAAAKYGFTVREGIGANDWRTK